MAPAPPSQSDLASQLSALQRDVADLTAAMDTASPPPHALADDALGKAALASLPPSLSSSQDLDLDPRPGGMTKPIGGVTAGFNAQIGTHSDNPSLTAVDFDIPAGATTLLSQLARAQRSLRDTTQERDELLLENRRLRAGAGGAGGECINTGRRSRSSERRSPPARGAPSQGGERLAASNADALIKMRQLMESLEKDHELLRLTLENSEKVRLQQKELIHLLQDHRVTAAPAGRSRRSQSPAPRRSTTASPRREPSRSSPSPGPSRSRGDASGATADGRPQTAPSSNHRRAPPPQPAREARPGSGGSSGSAGSGGAARRRGSRSEEKRAAAAWGEEPPQGGGGVRRGAASNAVAARARKTREAKVAAAAGRPWA
ncbi:hypothetical protein TeGR_g10680 [Tetraparma gracilis]|uniref:Uncharacterized protein n=1 Tax=Tetraparma gracilis TaxID=2962635 RepID=A0ABQ6NAL0_9STRA|nr:hypothetical protein TeGR_g10680 [Tetraparma gracilis]